MEILSSISAAITSTSFKISFLIFLFLLIAGFLILNYTPTKKTSKNLKKIDDLRTFDKDDIKDDFTEMDLRKQKYNELVKPYIKHNKDLYDRIINIFGIDLEILERKLISADISSVNAEQVSIIEIGGVLLGLFLSITLLLFFGGIGFFAGVFVCAMSLLLPNILIKEKYNARKSEMLYILPTTLKLLADATATGHTINDALSRVSKKYPNILSDEFKKATEEAKYSNDWILALEHMAERCDIEEIYNLVAEIKITQEKGTPITSVLLNAADNIEEQASINIAEVASKKSTTLLLPIFLFLFAPLIALVLLPAFDMVLSSL